MFDQIMVPLDGSSLAEAVLADLFTLASGSEAKVVLVGVIPAPSITRVAERLEDQALRGDDLTQDPDSIVAQVEHELTQASEEHMSRYLGDLASRLTARGLATRTRVRIGDPAAEIVRCADDEGVDAIAMSTHGRTGLDRLVHGSVADKVLRTAHLPVLLVRPSPEDFTRPDGAAGLAGSAPAGVT